jgi:hypothetical protein
MTINRASFMLLMLYCITSSCQPKKIDIDAEKTEIRQVWDNSVIALKDKNMGLISEIYAHDPNLLLIGFGPEWIVGWDTLRTVHQGLFKEATALQEDYSNLQIQISQSGQTAWTAANIQHHFHYPQYPDSTITKKLWQTVILEKRNNQWVVVHVHSSEVPPPDRE